MVLGGVAITLLVAGLPFKSMFQLKQFSGYPYLDMAAGVPDSKASNSPITGWMDKRVRQAAVPEFPYETIDNVQPSSPPVGGYFNGNIDVETFAGPSDAEDNAPSKGILGGLLAKIQARKYDSMMRQLAYLALAAVVVGGIATWTGRRVWVVATLALFFIISMYLSLRVSQGWDELYMNLRHSYMLATHGVFSANAQTMVEGTVDSLPYFLIGVLGKTGLRLDDLAIALALSGSLLIICVVFDMVARPLVPWASPWLPPELRPCFHVSSM